MIHTVKGLIQDEKIGKTMAHEHLLWDQSCYICGEPKEPSLKKLMHEDVNMENLCALYYNAHYNIDNIKQFDIGIAVEEVKHFKNAGGSTVVDVTSIGIGRNPKALLEISEATGLNVVMGSGYYLSSSHPHELFFMGKDDIAKLIMNEFLNGVDDADVKPGVIGEIGISDNKNEQELKILRASAIAQKETGAPIFIHPPYGTYALDFIDIVKEEGGDASKVVICHCDPMLENAEYLDAIAKTGAYIEFDQFGLEFPLNLGSKTLWLPRDIDRIRAVKRHIDMGNANNILISQDICFKTSLIKYGGWGYGHILRDLLGYMKEEGISDESLNMILTENPKRVLSF